MKRSLWRPLFAAVIVASAASGDASAAASPPPSEELHFIHDGRSRRAVIYDYSGGRPAPVVLVLHGGGGSAENAVQMTGFDRLAAREGAIAVFPEGAARTARSPFHTWNAGHCCSYAKEAGVDDVGFIEALIDRLVAEGHADPRRVYVTGMSNGAMMAHRLGRELSHKVAGIAPVVGAVFGDEAPPRGSVPAFIIVGADDKNVPGQGGPLRVSVLGGAAAADRDVAPAIEQARYWAAANGCAATGAEKTPVATTTRWTECRNGADVAFVTVAGNGHAWPGGRPGSRRGDTPTDAYDATGAIWAFFEAHVKPE